MTSSRIHFLLTRLLRVHGAVSGLEGRGRSWSFGRLDTVRASACHWVLAVAVTMWCILGFPSPAIASADLMPPTHGYDTSAVYDGAAHSALSHTSEAAPVASDKVAESVQATVSTATGPLFVLFPLSVAADSGTVFSGHGGIMSGEGGVIETTTVPKGTCIAFYCAHGEGIPDSLGNAIETGNAPAATEVFGPGSQVPNYRLLPPDGLNIAGNPVTVGEVTPLSELLKEGMGTCQWAACRKVY